MSACKITIISLIIISFFGAEALLSGNIYISNLGHASGVQVRIGGALIFIWSSIALLKEFKKYRNNKNK